MSQAPAPRVSDRRSPRNAAPAPWLDTLRLSLREFTPADADELFRLDRDPRVVRFVGNGKPTPRPEIDVTSRAVEKPGRKIS